ncbi:MAG: RNB domain-containing ribonuclease [Ilumatobacteraceae bacterium]
MASEAGSVLDDGIRRIRTELGLPSGFPPEAAMGAVVAARKPLGSRVDRTDRPFVTLDPADAIDLDQAFTIERAGGDLLLHYAIADVSAFVEPGDAVDQEAWKRGVTVYLPDQKARLYPAALSEGAASLLPDGPRPAVVFTVRIDGAGDVRLDGAERALIKSRAKLAYDTVRNDDLPDGFDELSVRIEAAEDRRGAPRVEFPDQELEHVNGAWVLRIGARLETEDQNAAMSLAANLAVADALLAAGTGLFRVMAEPGARSIERLRHTANAFGLAWPKGQSLADFRRTLDRTDPRANAFLIAVRRAGGGASYQALAAAAGGSADTSDGVAGDGGVVAHGDVGDGGPPWHSAMAATYAHATAPLRRLADRYVVDAAVAVVAGRPVDEHVVAAFGALPKVMAQAEAVANRADRAVIELAEAVIMTGREHEVFDAVVVDEDRHGTLVQLVDPAVLAHVPAHHVNPGDRIRVRLVAVDVTARRIELTRVG